MSFRGPLQVIKQISDTSTTGTVNTTFLLPQDIDSLVVKLWTGTTFSGTSPTADVYCQTTDDGGTTWYDCGRFDQLTTAVTNANAKWMEIPIQNSAANTPLGKGYTGSVASSTIGVASVSGLPILSQLFRVAIVYGGTIGTNSAINVNVLANNQASNQ